MTPTDDEAVRIPIDGVLDLHAFSPKDTKSVVGEYLKECLKKGIHEIRIIHGKGHGDLRRTVHSLLEKHPDVLKFNLDSGPSGWGATMVTLKRHSEN
jgi:DNA-nicking Smr family endonuclease